MCLVYVTPTKCVDIMQPDHHGNLRSVFYITTKFGDILNLAYWQFVTKLPNLDFTDIILIPCVQAFDSGC